MKRLFSLGVVVLLVVAGSARAEDKPDTKPVTIPFELLPTKHIAVMVKFNGKGPYRVIFDTGAPVSLLNPKTATAAGLPKPKMSLFGPAEAVKANTIEVGGLKAENISIIVMDHPTVAAISKAFAPPPIEGIIGFPFFARYKTTIDYQAKEMTLVPSGYDPPDVLKEMMSTVMALMSDKKPERKVLSPAAQWGMIVTKEEKDEAAGIIVKEVMAASAAARAGLKAGDRLLTLDGRWTDSVNDCYIAAGFVKAGTAVKLTVLRDGGNVELTVRPTSGL